MKQNQIQFQSFSSVLCHMLSETCGDLRFECYKSYEENINSPETLTREVGLALLIYINCPSQTLQETMGTPKY